MQVTGRVKPPDPDHMADLAFVATETGTPRSCAHCGVIAVPDVLLLEAAANGIDLPPSPALQWDDGRTVRFFQDPDHLAAGAR